MAKKSNSELKRLKTKISRLTNERDEVRKRLCFIEGMVRRMWSCQVAEQYGWDCFKEDRQ